MREPFYGFILTVEGISIAFGVDISMHVQHNIVDKRGERRIITS